MQLQLPRVQGCKSATDDNGRPAMAGWRRFEEEEFIWDHECEGSNHVWGERTGVSFQTDLPTGAQVPAETLMP